MLATDSPPSRLSSLLVVLGAGAIALALTADMLGIGSPGFGWRESAALALGAGLCLLGLVSPTRRRSAIARSWSEARPIEPAACMSIAVLFGLTTGFVEFGHQVLRRQWSPRVMPWPVESVWLIPACYAVFFVVLGLLLALPLRPWRRLITFPVAVFLFALFALWSQFLLHPTLDSIAVLALSAGGAWQVARVATRHAEGLERVSRWGSVGLSCAVVALATGMPLVRGWSERGALAELPQPPAQSPNVLVVVLDTVRTDHLPFHGYVRDTSPTMTAIADQAVVFDWMVSTSSWTVPAHATLFTGQYTHQLIDNGWMEALPTGPPTLAEAFTAAGYTTAGFVGNINYCCADRGFARGFTHYQDFLVTWEVTALASSFGQAILGQGPHRPRVRGDARSITDGFLGWLEDQDGSRPFFAFLNYFDAHALYLPPEGYDTLFGPRSPLLNQWRSQERGYSDEEMAGFERAYDGCIRFIDDQFRRIIERLEESGQLDNTLIVITGDHGEHFGEHGLLSHANSLYSPTVHVPLVVSYPEAINNPRHILRPVSLRDLAATIIDVAGIEPATPFPGQSLAPLWETGAPGEIDLSPALSELRPAGGTRGKPDWWPISRGDMQSILGEGGIHYILNGDDVAEMYDMRTDPDGLTNIIDTARGRQLDPGFRADLKRILAR